MENKEWAFWIEGEEKGQKQYFTGPEGGARLLQFLKDNDPIECGAQHLNVSTIAKLDALGDDGFLDESELV